MNDYEDLPYLKSLVNGTSIWNQWNIKYNDKYIYPVCAIGASYS